MRCRKCRQKAVIELPRHHTSFCSPCFTEFARNQVVRAIKAERMFGPDDRILVAVSGGKDSMALWHMLLTLGYRADALYVDLGIGTYSAQSREKVDRFANVLAGQYETTLLTHTVQESEGAGIRDLALQVHRPTCSACGTIKRYQFNRFAVEHHYDVMATGHNLDDEASRLLGNVLHWQHEYLDKQGPTLPASVEGFAKKVKPLYRLTEREIAAYAILNRIDYMVDECPMAKGSKMLLYKEVLNRLETESPGTKQAFYWGFLDKQAKDRPTSTSMIQKDLESLGACSVCGQPTTADTCGYCKLMARAQTAAKS